MLGDGWVGGGPKCRTAGKFFVFALPTKCMFGDRVNILGVRVNILGVRVSILGLGLAF